jgi:chromosome segregation ATPase
MSGRLQQERTTYQQQIGGLEAQVGALNDQVRQRDAQIVTLQASVTERDTSLEAVPTLQGEIEQLKAQAALVDRYRIAMRYPRLLGITVEETVPAEGEGEPTKRTVNPVLDLIESSGLDGPTLEITLQRMQQALPAAPVETSPHSPVTATAAPAPAEPAGDDYDAWVAKAREAQGKLNEGDQNAWTEFNEAAEKIRELQAKQV